MVGTAENTSPGKGLQKAGTAFIGRILASGSAVEKGLLLATF